MTNQLLHLVGCDGVGKSSILSKLQEQYSNAIYIKEPYNESFIKQIKETTDIFKIVDLFAHDRYLLYKDVEFPLQQSIISDRSFICSLVYQSLELESTHGFPPFTAIQHVYNTQLAIIPPTLVVFIHAEPLVIQRRLNGRSRDHHLDLLTIKNIQARYQLIFQLFNLNVINIDTTHQPIDINVSRILSYIQ